MSLSRYTAITSTANRKRSGQLLYIREIFRSSAGQLVRLQIAQADERNFGTAEIAVYASVVAIVERDSGDTRQNLDPQRGNAHSDDSIVLEKQRGRKLRCLETELAKDLDHAFSVVGTHGDPHVEVAGRARIP